MAKLSKIKALEICRDLWGWMAKHIDSSKEEWPGWKKYGMMRNDCPCCEYDNTHASNKAGWGDCSKCPLKGKWVQGYETLGGGSCVALGSPFDTWCNCNAADKKPAALAIRKLCVDELKRLKK